MLSATEKEWLNNYHKKIRETIQPFLSDREISWLISATKTIE
jgi:Xaa-Pro aminopeptidase